MVAQRYQVWTWKNGVQGIGIAVHWRLGERHARRIWSVSQQVIGALVATYIFLYLKKEAFVRKFYFVFPSGEHYLGMWKSDKFHGPGTLLRDGAYYCSDFRDGARVGYSSTMAELEQDVKWRGLFQLCAELLQHMVRSMWRVSSLSSLVTLQCIIYCNGQ